MLSAFALFFSARSLADDTVSLEVRVQVPSACSLGGSTYAINLGELRPAGSQAISFGIDCNAPFQYTIQSQQGGLRSSQSGVPASFIDLIPYTLRITIPTDAGGVSDLCDSSQLIGTPSCRFTSSGNGIAIAQTASMTLSWSTDKALMAGAYTDVITLSIRPLF